MANNKDTYLQLKNTLQKTLEEFGAKINKLEKEKDDKTSLIKEKMATFSSLKLGDYVEVMNDLSSLLFIAMVDRIEVNDLGEIGYGVVTVDPNTLEPLMEFDHIHKSRQFKGNRLKKIEDINTYFQGIKEDEFLNSIKTLDNNYQEAKSKIIDLYIKQMSDVKIGSEVFIDSGNKETKVLIGGRVFNINIVLDAGNVARFEYVVEFHNKVMPSMFMTFSRDQLTIKEPQS